jgi:hypothetical protein
VLDASTSTNILKVLGNSGDSVNALGFAKLSGTEIESSITYDVYTHSGANTDANAALLVQQDVVSIKLLPSRFSVSILLPPSTRARLFMPVRSHAAMLPALMIMVSLPAPALRTSIPP